jgi:glycosyl transferase family 1
VKITFLGNHAISYSSESHHAASLESLGHKVVRLQEVQTTGERVLAEALQSDMLVVVHTHGWFTPGVPLVDVLAQLKVAGIPTVTYHLDLWLGLARQHELDADPFYRSIEWFFTVDKLMANWFRTNTPVKGVFLPAGVFDQECYISDEPSPHANDVIFVGSRGYHDCWPWRVQLLDWLHETYGPRFTHVGGDGDTGTIRGDELNRVYANSKVAVGDTLCLNFDYPFYTSDRLFECAGRGGVQVWPYIRGVDEWFTDGEHLRFFDFGDFGDLKTQIDYLLEHDEEREQMRKAGHELVKAEHTYVNRWETILETVFG